MDSSAKRDQVRSKIPKGFFDLTSEQQLDWALALVESITHQNDPGRKEGRSE